MAVLVYREIQRLEAGGFEYSKSALRDEVINSSFLRRSAGSYEYRMQNISAVLDGLGQAWLAGYKPAGNVGTAVEGRIRHLLAAISLT